MQAGYGLSPIEILACEAMLAGQIYCQNYVYSAQWLTGQASALGATSTVEQTTQINGDSDFVVQRIHLAAWSAVDTPITDPDYVLQIQIGGSARNLFDKPIGVNAIIGSFLSDKQPNNLPFPYLVEMNNNLVATLTNRSSTAANRVDLAYDGFRIFYQGAGDTDQMRRKIFKKLPY
jgi:hypothetical protein